MFFGRGKLLRTALIFGAIIVLGVVQWFSQKAKHDEPLSGTVRVLVVPHAAKTASCKDWMVDVYLENTTGYELELNGFTVRTSFDGQEEESAQRGTLSTKADQPIWELPKAKQTRIWHVDDGCTTWAGHGNWEKGKTEVQYKVTAYTSEGVYSALAKTTVSIPTHF